MSGACGELLAKCTGSCSDGPKPPPHTGTLGLTPLGRDSVQSRVGRCPRLAPGYLLGDTAGPAVCGCLSHPRCAGSG